MNIQLKRFFPGDWQTYKAIRLEALLSDPQYFWSAYADEVQRTDQEWADRLLENDIHGFWGLYFDGECIGMTAIWQQSYDPTGADLTSSYIRKGYRLNGLSVLYYQARIAWAMYKGYKHLDVHIRRSNQASLAASRKFNFVHFHTDENLLWPDGTYDDSLSYRLIL
jgi:RimJ/RimL family protein N-acetyltransferase